MFAMLWNRTLDLESTSSRRHHDRTVRRRRPRKRLGLESLEYRIVLSTTSLVEIPGGGNFTAGAVTSPLEDADQIQADWASYAPLADSGTALTDDSVAEAANINAQIDRKSVV